MTRLQLEHIIRASAAIADDRDIVVVGSQSILGQFPSAQAELLVSREADVYPRNFPDRWDLIDGAIGEGSPFEARFGYYAHGVGEETSILPSGWQSRLVLISNENTLHVRGWCLEVHDLAISMHAAGTEDGIEFTGALARHGMTQTAILLERLEQTPVSDEARRVIHARILAQDPTSAL